MKQTIKDNVGKDTVIIPNLEKFKVTQIFSSLSSALTDLSRPKTLISHKSQPRFNVHSMLVKSEMKYSFKTLILFMISSKIVE